MAKNIIKDKFIKKIHQGIKGNPDIEALDPERGDGNWYYLSPDSSYAKHLEDEAKTSKVEPLTVGEKISGKFVIEPQVSRGLVHKIFNSSIRSRTRGEINSPSIFKLSRKTKTLSHENSDIPIFISSPSFTFSKGITNFTDGNFRESSFIL